jgi:hypothetical protein
MRLVNGQKRRNITVLMTVGLQSVIKYQVPRHLEARASGNYFSISSIT